MTGSDVVVAVGQLPAEAQVLDVRWGLTDPPGAGRAAYLAGHLPGARFLDLEAVLTGRRLDPAAGRHPLPSPSRLADGLGRLGLDPGRPIVVYDQPGSFAAGRAWWVLRWAGLDVTVLDGGWPAWLSAGQPVETGQVVATATDISVTIGQMPTIEADAIAGWAGSLVDVRAGERFCGEIEPIDPRAGHIPGAVNRPVSRLWTADGFLPGEAELEMYFAGLRSPLAVYCGSGVSAAQAVLAATAIGLEATLYAGSWSGWSSDPAHPIALGKH